MHILYRLLGGILFAVLTSPAAVAAKTRPAPATPGADEGLRQAFERVAYSLEDSGHGTWRGENPAQRLTLEFDGREARLSHADGSVSFHLAGYGYSDRLRKPAPATLTGTGNRVEYQRGDLSEWYLNSSQGLEQGFTLARRPGADRADEPLVIALEVSGGLAPVRKADDDAVLFESGKGAVLRYAGLKAVDARGRILPSRLEVRGREIRLTVEDRDARYPLVVDPTWTVQAKLFASNLATDDYFGTSVSVSGDTAVIGANNKNNGKGAAYVFVRSGRVWSQQTELTANDGAAGDNFGISVSVSGYTAVIGAPGKIGNQGVAYVFVGSGGVWSQQQRLMAYDGAAGDQFGISVSVNGDTAVIGASGRNTHTGAAYVFVRYAGGMWSQHEELTASDGAAGNYFGSSVSVSGDTAVIGAWDAAYVFVRRSGAWSEQQKLTASDEAAGDQFGDSVSVSGDTAVIGANGTNDYQGAAYVFVRSGGSWSQQQELTASDGAGALANFGWSVSVSGDTAVIGADTKNIGSNPIQGAAYVFARSAGVWSQLQELTASDGAATDYFGGSVSVSGGTVLIGAANKEWLHLMFANPGAGAAYVFGGAMLGANALLVGSAGGTSSVELVYNGAWTATANDSFLHISAGSASGTGNAVVVFSYDAFSSPGTRTGTLTIAGLTVTVTQAGTNYIGPGPVTTLVSPGLNNPYYGVAVDGSGNVYIADAVDDAIKEWSAVTQQVTTLLSSGLNDPRGVAVDGSGNVYIADEGNNAIKEWSVSTQQVTTLVSSGLSDPWGVAVDGSGNVYIADEGDNAIKEWSASTQQVTTLVSSGLNWPYGVAVDVSGNVYIADTYNSAIKEWSPATQHVTTLASGPVDWPYGLAGPRGVAVDGSGNVYIADTGNEKIKEWSASTQQVATLVSSGLAYSEGVAVDGSGNVYIADGGYNGIEEIPYAFVGPASLAEPGSAGSDSLLPVLPSTISLAGIFAPTSDQSWLTIGTIANGVVSFSFTANTSNSDRVAHITVLGQQIAITQDFTSAEFSDVPPSATFFDAANLMFLAGVTTGCVQSNSPQTREYCPNDNVTRQEMAAFIVRAVTGTVNPAIYNTTPYFSDVPASNSFFPHIQKLIELGITTGCSQNPPMFCPTDTIPRWEMAMFMIRARLMLYGASFTPESSTPYFTDVPTNVEGNGQPFPFIQRSFEEHITNGCGGTLYCPDTLVTRGQMASFIMRGLFNQTMAIGPTAPYLTGASPNAVAATVGSRITVTITGVNTSFQSGNTVTVPSGMLTVSNVVVNSATSITATLTVNGAAVAGPQALVVTSGGQNLTLPLAIKVGIY